MRRSFPVCVILIETYKALQRMRTQPLESNL